MVSTNPGQSPAPAPTSESTSLQLAQGEANPQQCLTPPSVRRREARIARCMVIRDARRAATAATAEAEQGEPGGREPAPVRLGYTPEEVRIRRRDHHREQQRMRAAAEAATQGDHLDRTYGRPPAGEPAAQNDPALLIRPDGTVDWDAARHVMTAELDATTLATLQDTPALPLRGPAEAGPLTLAPANAETPAGWPSSTLLLSVLIIALHLLQGRRSRRRSSAAEADAPTRKFSAARRPDA